MIKPVVIYTVNEKFRSCRISFARIITRETMEEKRLTVIAGQSVRDGLTAKQEAFAQAVAKGSTLADAYREAYDAERMKDSSIWTNASQLMSETKVALRVNAIQKAQEERTLHDHARLKRLVLERLHEEAVNAPSDSARIRALELLGKSIAMFTDRVEQDDQSRTSADIEQELADRLRELTGS